MISKINFETPSTKIQLDVRITTKEAVEPGRTIDWEPVTTYQELSICAEIWRRAAPGRRWIQSMFGQCRGEVREHAAHLAEAEREALFSLLSIWERWHLNGMNAGMRPQRAALQSEARTRPEVLEYSAACRFLENLGQLTMPHTQYTYGAAWLVELLPEDIEQEVRRLCRVLGGKVLEAA